MSLTVSLIVGFVAGLACGAAYFGALWRSVSGLSSRQLSMARFFVAASARALAAITVVALAAGAGADAIALFASVMGFMSARVLATARARAGLAQQQD